MIGCVVAPGAKPVPLALAEMLGFPVLVRCRQRWPVHADVNEAISTVGDATTRGKAR